MDGAGVRRRTMEKSVFRIICVCKDKNTYNYLHLVKFKMYTCKRTEFLVYKKAIYKRCKMLL